jgi:ribosomal protein L11 methyltransferase
LVLAIDIDPVAVRAARNNTRINGVDDHIRVKRGTLSLRAQREFKSSFDLALANITARAISEFSPGFARVLKPGGKLVVSGIPSQGLDEVLISLALVNFKLETAIQDGEWYVVAATNS